MTAPATPAEIVGHLKLVQKVAAYYQGRGFDLDDLIGEGTLGLFAAGRKFDATRGVPWKSYAARSVAGFILTALKRRSRTIRIPGRIQDALNAGLTPESPGLTGQMRECLRDALVLLGRAHIRDHDLERGNLAGIVPDPVEPTPHDPLRERGVRLDAIPELEATVIRRRFGLDGEPAGRDELAAQLGMTRWKVTDLERTGIKRLREQARSGRVPIRVESLDMRLRRKARAADKLARLPGRPGLTGGRRILERDTQQEIAAP